MIVILILQDRVRRVRGWVMSPLIKILPQHPHLQFQLWVQYRFTKVIRGSLAECKILILPSGQVLRTSVWTGQQTAFPDLDAFRDSISGGGPRIMDPWKGGTLFGHEGRILASVQPNHSEFGVSQWQGRISSQIKTQELYAYTSFEEAKRSVTIALCREGWFFPWTS